MENVIYKSARLIGGKVRMIIENENGNIINKNPTKEQIDSAILSNNRRKYYNKTNTCDRCGNRFADRVYREYNKEENWTGKWLCSTCSYKDYNKNNSDSRDNISKLLRYHRIGNLDNHGKKLIFETLTCKVHNVKNLNIENDNYISPMDHSPDPISGDIFETKGSVYDPIRKRWHNGRFENEHNKNFKTMIFYCAGKGLINIIRMYEFPKEDVTKRTGITIYDDDKSHWYDKYRIDEESYNDALRNLTIDDFPQFDRKKCKEWLDMISKKL